ncbi:MAG: PorV/PorQ family protein [Candidatus Zixiibacteriota bacterium]
MRKIITVAILTAFLAGSASAEFSKVGSSGAQFLKIAVGSKYQAMGEASVAMVDDIYATFWNPAGLAAIENNAVSFTNVDYLLDINLNYIGFARNFEDIGVFAVSATFLTMDDMEITTLEEQEGSGEYYSAASYTAGISYAKQLNSKFAFGATFKYIGEQIHNERSEGFAFDFGTMLRPGVSSLRLGISITNMGPELTFSGSDLVVQYYDELDEDANPVSAELQTNPYDLPLAFRIGAAYDVDFASHSVLTLSSELKHSNDNDEKGAIGAQLGFDERFFLRGGYKINYDEEGLTVGGGINTGLSSSTRLIIDYAWQDFGRLESTQRFSIGFTF